MSDYYAYLERCREWGNDEPLAEKEFNEQLQEDMA